MLSEVNRLRNLIIDRPPTTYADGAIWDALQRFRIVVLYDPDDNTDWDAFLGDDDLAIPYDHTQTYGVQANIRRALEAIDAEPFDSAYVCFKPDDLQEAANTRIGTIQVGGAVHDVIPDVFLRDFPNALAQVQNLTHPSSLGFLAENVVTVGAGAPRLGDGQVVWAPRFFSRQEHIHDGNALCNVRLLILGRYFSSGDVRHEKHQLSRRMTHLKEMNAHGKIFARALGGGLRIVNEHHPIDIVTRIPPKPSKADRDHLSWILEQACDRADGTFNLNPRLTPCLNPELLRCAREYPSQKDAGSYQDRAANVNGAFIATAPLRGEHVVLVDDVLTSGSTTAECARVLLAAGAGEVTVLAIARNQRVITGPHAELECPCGDGVLVLRKGSGNEELFWGCSAYHETNCTNTQTWSAGIRAYNQLNTRDDIPLDDDIDF